MQTLTRSVVALLLILCAPATADVTLELIPVATMARPVVVTHAGDGSDRLFVATQTGQVRIVENGVLLPTPLLDPSAGQGLIASGERGLLGLAFHPDYASPGAPGEGLLYAFFSVTSGSGGNHDSVVAEFRVTADPNVADPGSRRDLLRVVEPRSNHNGGDLHFGPDDGRLYISVGDSGGGGDPDNDAQDLGTLRGRRRAA